MSDLYELIHTEGRGDFVMPYTPAIKVTGGSLVFLAGVTAAPVYHSHPHIAAEFDGIPADPGAQAEMAMDQLEAVLRAAGTDLGHVAWETIALQARRSRSPVWQPIPDWSSSSER